MPAPTPDDAVPRTPNPLKRRDPDLVKNLAAFRARIGDTLLDSLAPVLADARLRAHYGAEFVTVHEFPIDLPSFVDFA